MPTGAMLYAERGPLWYPQFISFTQTLRHLVVSEEKQCPAVNTLGLAHNKFEFRGTMILISSVTLDKSHAAAICRIAVSCRAALPPPSVGTMSCLELLTGLYLHYPFVK